MKILTWNVERLKKGTTVLAEVIRRYDADIIVLTETGSSLRPGKGYNVIQTEVLPELHDGFNYKNENRCSIWTRHDIKEKKNTYDNYTAACVDVQINGMPLTIYGGIIGIAGGKGERFKTDLDATITNIRNLEFENLCFAGDFNTMLSGYAYPSHEARIKLNGLFNEMGLICLTANLRENVNHIVLSSAMLEGRKVTVETWNEDKKLSDHIGICLTIE